MRRIRYPRGSRILRITRNLQDLFERARRECFWCGVLRVALVVRVLDRTVLGGGSSGGARRLARWCFGDRRCLRGG